MPLEIFAIIVPLGIAAIVLIVRYSGLSKTAILHDQNSALRVFEGDYAGEAHRDIAIISDDRRAAFISMVDINRLGLVEAMGDRFITRLLGPGDIKNAALNCDQNLEIKFDDFTHPKGSYKFSPTANMKQVIEWTKRLQR